MPEPRISLIVPVRDEAAQTLRCLTRLALLPDDPSFEVVLVDDGSRDETASILAALEGDVQVVSNAEPVGFGRASDQAVELATGEHVVIVNNDAIPCAGWLDELVAVLDADPRSAAAVPRSVDREGTFLCDAHWLALAVRRAAYREVGGFSGTARAGRAEKASLLDALVLAGYDVSPAPRSLLLAA